MISICVWLFFPNPMIIFIIIFVAFWDRKSERVRESTKTKYTQNVYTFEERHTQKKKRVNFLAMGTQQIKKQKQKHNNKLWLWIELSWMEFRISGELDSWFNTLKFQPLANDQGSCFIGLFPEASRPTTIDWERVRVNEKEWRKKNFFLFFLWLD